MFLKLRLSNKYFLLLAVLFWASIQNSHADGFVFRKYAGEFMDIGVSPRAQGMGGAFTAISGDIAAAYYNAAGLYGIKSSQISFMHTQQMLASVNYDYLSFGRYQTENSVIAVSLVRLGIDNIKDSRAAQVLINGNPDNWRLDWNKIKEFNAADYVFAFSMAHRWVHGLILGGNIKLIRRNLADHSANGIGFDLGIQRKFFRNLTVAANARNATTTLIAWDTGEKEMVKPSFYLGSAYLLNIHGINSSFQPAVDLIFRGEGWQKSARAYWGIVSFDFAAGIEYGYHNTIFIRTGIDEIRRLNMGVGVHIPHVRIDYAYTNYDQELGNSHRIGLLVKF